MKKQPAKKKTEIEADPEKKYINSENYSDDDHDEQEIEPEEFDDNIEEWPEDDDDQ